VIPGAVHGWLGGLQNRLQMNLRAALTRLICSLKLKTGKETVNKG
jgi:hypothetical protein